MATALRILLLVAAVAGAVLRPANVPRFIPPLVCTAIGLVSGLVPAAEARGTVESMGVVVGFLLAAIPLAVMLDDSGYFEQLASLFGGGRMLVPGLWVLAAATVAVLNLDAAVVLLTPLYLRVAERQRRSALFLGFQPVLLALLASSLLPVSNLTNLIVSAHFDVTTADYLLHLGLPTLVACVVGYPLYCWSLRVADPSAGPAGALAAGAGSSLRGDAPGAADVRNVTVSHDRRVLTLGSLLVAAVLAGFTLGPAIGVSDWEVALAADVVLVVVTRRLPWRSIPLGTAVVATALAVLATAATKGLDLAWAFSGSGPLAELRLAAIAGAAANVLNNLPALLVALPHLGPAGGRPTCALWPVLYGVNAGPGLVVTGSLASLLWLDGTRRFGAVVHAGQFFRMGLRVVIPAALAGLAVLIAIAPAIGCG